MLVVVVWSAVSFVLVGAGVWLLFAAVGEAVRLWRTYR